MNPIKAFTLVALGLAIAGMGIYVANADDIAAALFPQSQKVPSVIHTAPPPSYAAAADRARELVRATVIQEQNLPGVSVAVGADGDHRLGRRVGSRDVRTRTPVTPDTRFNIGTAASAVAGRRSRRSA